MTAKGWVQGRTVSQVIEQCTGCGRQGQQSSVGIATSVGTSIKWRNGVCSLATRVGQCRDGDQAEGQPIKASSAAGK
jgi:hypothetical protein